MFFKKYRGSSLIEVMVSVGFLGAMSLVVMHIGGESAKTVAKIELASDIDVSVNEINGFLADPYKCKATFNATTEPNSIVSQIEAGVVTGRKYSTTLEEGKRGYGHSRFEVTSYELTGEPPDVVLTIKYDKAGDPKAHKTIELYLLGDLTADPPRIDLCRSVGSVDIWTRGDGNDIYYSGGNLGIKGKNPNFALYVDGEVLATNSEAGAPKNNVTANIMTYTGGAVYVIPSDRRLKTNIGPIDNPLEKITSLRGVAFDWRSNDQHDVGFIAQEVQQQIPEIVAKSTAGDTLTVDYARVVPVLVEAVKMQQAQIEELKKEINSL
ncbi:MAG: tail fiber domain-containing protein [Candidatus Marinimicrobia bacterium]|nr:tail fiber domain-containing protein [Candidatus Neomarinimicrobiota bacterium]